MTPSSLHRNRKPQGGKSEQVNARQSHWKASTRSVAAPPRIAIFLPEKADGYFTEVLLGIARYAHSNVAWQFDLEAAGDVTLGNFQQEPCDGIILAADLKVPEVINVVAASGIPAVNVARAISPRFPQVAPDNREVGRVVARQFLSRGFRHFGYVGMERYNGVPVAFDHERFEGFNEPIAAAGLSVSVFDTFDRWGEFGKARRREYTPLADWLLHIGRPAAIMAATDLRGRQLLLTASRIGVRVPEDVAVVAVDNHIGLCEVTSPALSSVQLDGRKAGYQAAGLLDRLMHRRATDPLPMLIPPLRLVERRSSDVLALEDADVAEALRFITENERRPTRVGDVAAAALVSRRALERRFRKLLGRSVQEEIHRVHIQRAKRLLADETLSIQRVASAAGFSSPRHLSVLFRRSTGISPTDYRRQILSAPFSQDA